MADTTIVYIRLLDEGTLVYRPAKAKKSGENAYKILPTEDYEYAGENWEFPPGSMVSCEFRKSGNEDILVAVATVIA